LFRNLAIISRRNAIELNGITYSTLGDVLVDGLSLSCQTEAITIPAGWSLVLDTSEARMVVASHSWSTQIIMLATSISAVPALTGVGTANMPSPGAPYFYFGTYCAYESCSVSPCYYYTQILIKQTALHGIVSHLYCIIY
jgi:hypothetical protein